MRWIAGGVAGWFAAVAPLLGVNIAGYANVFDTETAVIAGAAALVGGILLGGIVAGLVAGRASAQRAGGATATLPAGGAAGALYVISLVSVVVVATRMNAAPAVVVDHPIRITVAILCLGAILLGVALLVGMLVGRFGATPAPAAQSATRAQGQQNMARPQTPSAPRHGQNPGQPVRNPYPDSVNRDYNGQGRGYGVYDEYDERQPARNPSGSSVNQSSRDAGRDDGWRQGRR